MMLDARNVHRAQRQRIEQDLAREPFFFAKCIPSWPPSPEIRTARAKFTDFLTF